MRLDVTERNAEVTLPAPLGRMHTWARAQPWLGRFTLVVGGWVVVGVTATSRSRERLPEDSRPTPHPTPDTNDEV